MMKIHKSKEIDKLLSENELDWSDVSDIFFSFNGSDEYYLIERSLELGKKIAGSKNGVYQSFDEYGVYYFIGNRKSIINKIRDYIDSEKEI